MSQTVESSDYQKWHKRFAIECNNRAWELSIQPRTPPQDREMLDMAHASAWHWAQIGPELNRMRATMLLAEVHALLGYDSTAYSYAREMRTYFLNHDSPDWELAFTHTIYAHAAIVAGEVEEHHSAYNEANKALQLISDDEDRNIVLRTYNQVPPL